MFGQVGKQLSASDQHTQQEQRVGGCGGTHLKYIKNMENKFQGNILLTGYIGNGLEISRNIDISLDDSLVKEKSNRFSMALSSLCTTIASDKIHLIKTTKLLRV